MEEELEEAEEEEAAGEEKSSAALVVVPTGDLGDGIEELRLLYERFKAEGVEPELEEAELAALHAKLARDAPKCPSVDTLAWIVRTLEELVLEEDGILEALGQILTARADELQPQSVLDAVCSYGNVYWAGDDELLDALAGATRRQLADFTSAEVARLANGLTRMGATDDTKHVGLFFEMRKRVNLPHIDKFIKESMNRDAQVYKDRSETTQLALKALENMPNSRLKAKAERHLQFEIETKVPKLLESMRVSSELHNGWESMKDIQRDLFKADPDKKGSDAEAAGPPEIRFQDMVASASAPPEASG